MKTLLEETNSVVIRGRKICSAYFVMKMLFLISAVVVVILLALVIRNSVSLKSFNERLEDLKNELEALQNEKPLKGEKPVWQSVQNLDPEKA